jgi:hypothetical protein
MASNPPTIGPRSTITPSIRLSDTSVVQTVSVGSATGLARRHCSAAAGRDPDRARHGTYRTGERVVDIEFEVEVEASGLRRTWCSASRRDAEHSVVAIDLGTHAVQTLSGQVASARCVEYVRTLTDVLAPHRHNATVRQFRADAAAPLHGA